jgi:hypothetical protein
MRYYFTTLLQGVLINYVSILLFVCFGCVCFICVLFIVRCYLCLYVVLFLYFAIWLLTRHINKLEFN